jgi:hypothetical protein
LREAPAAAVATMPAPRASTANARGHAVVRAALEWVAADPGGAALPRAVAQPNERSTAALPQRDPHEVPSAHQDRSRIVVGEAPAGPIQAAPAAKASIASATARAEPGVAAAPRNLASPVDRPTAQAPRDERVEVTIGEIHILGDAPAQPAASRVASPPPAAAPRPAPEQAAARSGLARRALRRI